MPVKKKYEMDLVDENINNRKLYKHFSFRLVTLNAQRLVLKLDGFSQLNHSGI